MVDSDETAASGDGRRSKPRRTVVPPKPPVSTDAVDEPVTVEARRRWRLVVAVVVPVVVLAALVGGAIVRSMSDGPSVKVGFEHVPVAPTVPDRVTCPTQPVTQSPLPALDGHTEDPLVAGQVVPYHLTVTGADTRLTSFTARTSWAADVGSGSQLGVDGRLGVLCAFSLGADGPAVTLTRLTGDAGRAGADIALQGVRGSATIELWVALAASTANTTKVVLASHVDALRTPNGPLDADVRQASLDVSLLATNGEVDTVDATMTGPSGPTAPGATIIDRLTVHNAGTQRANVAATVAVNGPAAVFGVTVNDTTGARSTCTASGDGAASCQFGFLAPGEQLTVDIAATVNEGADGVWPKSSGTCEDGRQDVCTTVHFTVDNKPAHLAQVEQPSSIVRRAVLALGRFAETGIVRSGASVAFTYLLTSSATEPAPGPDGDRRRLPAHRPAAGRQERRRPPRSRRGVDVLVHGHGDRGAAGGQGQCPPRRRRDRARPQRSDTVRRVAGLQVGISGDALVVVNTGDDPLADLTVSEPTCQAPESTTHLVAPSATVRFACATTPPAGTKAYATDSTGAAVTAAAP